MVLRWFSHQLSFHSRQGVFLKAADLSLRYADFLSYLHLGFSLEKSYSQYMFFSSYDLVGAVPYDSSKTDASMANYETGYFTLKNEN